MWGMIQREKNNLTVVDLFCGAGVGACGIKLAGFDIIYAIDNNQYAVDTYNKNIGNHAVCRDIKKLDFNDIPDHDVMIATPVCKSFSLAGSGRGVNDEKYGDLSFYFLKALKTKKPKAFLFENVNGMATKPHINFLTDFIEELEGAGYNITWEVINCSDHGVPQDRKRLFIIGIRKDIRSSFSFPRKVDKKTTIRQAIYDIKDRPDIPNNKDVSCETFSPRYRSRNRQRQWDEQAFTVVSEARQLALYPEPKNYDIRVEDIFLNPPPRRLKVRECLRLQTVPDWFVFDDNVPLNKQYERCSGIPSLMAYKLGIEIERCLDEEEN